jgi:hypothetical protein
MRSVESRVITKYESNKAKIVSGDMWQQGGTFLLSPPGNVTPYLLSITTDDSVDLLGAY